MLHSVVKVLGPVYVSTNGNRSVCLLFLFFFNGEFCEVLVMHMLALQM